MSRRDGASSALSAPPTGESTNETTFTVGEGDRRAALTAGVLTFLPESCARILLEQIKTLVVPASACTYRLAARVFETLEFDKRKEQEGQNYGNVILREGYPPNAKVIQDGAMAHLDRIGLKFNSIHNRTDDGGFPTREWRIGWTVTERFQYPVVASIPVLSTRK